MGLQCIYAAYGGSVDRVGEIVHGKTSKIIHDGKGMFKDVPEEIKGTRYHSLAGSFSTLPQELEVSCRTPRIGQVYDAKRADEGIVMGIRHKKLTLESVQYHPESILSDAGQVMLANFMKLRGGSWEENVGFGLSAREKSKENGVQTPTSSKKNPSPESAPTILTRIYDQRRQDVETAKKTPGSYQSDLTALLDLHIAPPQISFYDRLLPSANSQPSGSKSQLHPSSGDAALMAEVKRASPSKGDILPASSPLTAATIGLSYAQAGASVISVLTEPTWFKGTLNDMRAVRQVVSTLPHRPAVLRKDFIFDTYQIDEARLYGADTILLIVAMLDDTTLKKLYDYARFVRGMEPLVEVNNPEELQRALAIGAKVIGVNNRNLHDFNVDMSTTSRIAEVVNQQQQHQQTNGSQAVDDRKVILCALSGITGRDDVVRYVQQGVGAVLVGEALMRAEDQGAFVRTLLGIDEATPHSKPKTRRASLTAPPDSFSPPSDAPTEETVPTNMPAEANSYKPLVKICGVKTPEAALAAAEGGADFVGLIFAPKSKRYVTPEQARRVVDAVRQRTASFHDRQTTTHGKASTIGQNEDDTSVSSDYFESQARRLSHSRRKPLFVGVFQNAPLSTIEEVADTVHLDVVQLHGSEPAEWCQLLKIPTFKAFHVDESLAEDDLDKTSGEGDAATKLALHEAARPGYHSIPLLDTKLSKAAGGLSGGAGKVFDWQVARNLCQTDRPGLPIILAGGLEVHNVANAVKMVRPWALDVSGGVETKGEKDLDKIRDFIRAAKGAVP